MAVLLTEAADLISVRRVLDVSLTEDLLPDAVIQDAIYLDAAEADVLRRDPAAASYTGAAAKRARAAVIYLTAARLLPALPRIIGERFGNQHQYQRQAVDVTQRVEELEALADRELAFAKTPVKRPRPKLFVAASGGRGR